ncbi:MAG: RNA repair domain-containing protein [archaeon GB-1867-005]|nr:RNA repair domain-containing protein [Candidatus Culexmicrobium cathedralense]
MSRIREILNRIFWHPNEDPKKYEIVFVHRGAPNNLKVIPAWCIVKVNPGSFEYSIGGEYARIPFHRIVVIRDVKSGKIVWRSRRHGAAAFLEGA